MSKRLKQQARKKELVVAVRAFTFVIVTAKTDKQADVTSKYFARCSDNDESKNTYYTRGRLLLPKSVDAINP